MSGTFSLSQSAAFDGWYKGVAFPYRLWPIPGLVRVFEGDDGRCSAPLSSKCQLWLPKKCRLAGVRTEPQHRLSAAFSVGGGGT